MCAERRPIFWWKLILGHNNVTQSMDNRIGPVHDLLSSASGAMSNSKIVYGRRQLDSSNVSIKLTSVRNNHQILYIWVFIGQCKYNNYVTSYTDSTNTQMLFRGFCFHFLLTRWGWGVVTSFIWHSTDDGCACRMAPFFSAARYMIGPLFATKKYMTGPIFLDWYMKGPTISYFPVYAESFHSEIF